MGGDLAGKRWRHWQPTRPGRVPSLLLIKPLNLVPAYGLTTPEFPTIPASIHQNDGVSGCNQPAAGPPSNPGFVMFAGSRMRSSSSSERLVFSRATSRTVFPVL